MRGRPCLARQPGSGQPNETFLACFPRKMEPCGLVVDENVGMCGCACLCTPAPCEASLVGRKSTQNFKYPVTFMKMGGYPEKETLLAPSW